MDEGFHDFLSVSYTFFPDPGREYLDFLAPLPLLTKRSMQAAGYVA